MCFGLNIAKKKKESDEYSLFFRRINANDKGLPSFGRQTHIKLTTTSLYNFEIITFCGLSFILPLKH